MNENPEETPNPLNTNPDITPYWMRIHQNR